jgi:transcriptional regulator with XRE-family HTH domain
MAERRLNGTTVRALRESLGVPHGVFANDIQVSAGYLTNIEKNLRQPSPPVVKKIADRLGVAVDAITYPVAEPVAS